jgi:hypothetical protein
MSWLARCSGQLISEIHEFSLLWFEAYGRISPFPPCNFPETEHQEAKPSLSRLEEDEYSRPAAVRLGTHLTIVRPTDDLTGGIPRCISRSPP